MDASKTAAHRPVTEYCSVTSALKTEMQGNRLVIEAWDLRHGCLLYICTGSTLGKVHDARQPPPHAGETSVGL